MALLLSEIKKIGKRVTWTAQLRNRLLVSGTLLATGCGGAYLFRDKFKQTLMTQTKDIAKESLDDQSVKVHVGNFSQDLVNQVLQDEQTYNYTKALVRRIAQDPEIIDETRKLLEQALEHPSFQAKVRKELAELCQHPETRKLLAQVGKDAIKDLSQDPEVMKMLEMATWTAIKGAMTPNWLKSL